MPKSIRKKSGRKYRMKKTDDIHKKVTKYICKRKERKSPSGKIENKKRDVCCERDYNREKIVKIIIDQYKKMFDDEYLDWIFNDVIKFIGYQNSLDEKGLSISKEIEDLFVKSKEKRPWILVTEDEFKTLLMDFPLYYLLAFLGSSVYMDTK